MNSLDALYFPFTTLSLPRQYPMFLLLPRIHILTLMEPSPDAAGQPVNSFINSGCCQAHTPCPLGNDRERFQRLVRDIKERTDDYAAQLSALTLASMTTPTVTGEEHERSIIGSLIPQEEKNAKKSEEETQEKLWQARLTLAIGELLDQQNEEINRHLAEIEGDERELLQELQGEDETMDDDFPGDNLFPLQTTMPASPVLARKRFKAWATLHSCAAGLPENLWITTDPDCADMLLESYEKKTARSPLEPLSLLLPAVLGSNDQDALAKSEKFIAREQELISEVQAVLQRLITMEARGADYQTMEQAAKTIATKWNEAMDATFPAEQFGRMMMIAHLFPKTANPTLLEKESGVATSSGNSLLFVVN